MKMLRFELVSAPDFREFVNIMNKHKQGFYEAAMRLVVRDIVEGINAHRAIGGGSLPALEESTVRKKGHNMQLIDRGLLGDIETYDMQNNYRADNGVIVIKPRSKPREIIRQTKSGKWTTRGRSAPRGSTPEQKAEFKKKNYDTPRDEVAFYLQVEGVGKKKKKFPFFGISQDAGSEILNLVDDIVARALGGLAK